MFNVKRNGASVEITDIPQSIPFGVFKNITDETGAYECLITCPGGKENYEVVIRHDSANMAGTVAWMVLEAREQENDIKEIKGLIGGTPEDPKPFSNMYVYDDLIKISGGIPLSYLEELNNNLPKLLDKSVFDGISNGVFSAREFGAGMKMAEWTFSTERAAREVGDMIVDYLDSNKYEMRAKFIMPARTDYDNWVQCGIPGGLIKAPRPLDLSGRTPGCI
ncbi:TPA: hypothetical protein JC757_002847 [Salmonella enterica subsp. diarizonae]|nr:hypothetical protein [Salmonella enterica subsp. diarizonae]